MVKALIFDVFGTVVDWRSGIAREAQAFFESRGLEVEATAFAVAWRAKYQPSMERIRSGNRGYIALDILHRENLDETLVEFGLTGQIDDDSKDEFNHAWEKLPPWPDCVSGLTRLKTRYAIAPCSNGSIALMTWLAKSAGLPWDAIVGAEVARAYKPQPEVYRASAAALGLARSEVMMVAAHNSDLAAARAEGLATAFVPRPQEHGPGQTTDLAPDSDWDLVAADFNDLADKLSA